MTLVKRDINQLQVFKTILLVVSIVIKQGKKYFN